MRGRGVALALIFALCAAAAAADTTLRAASVAADYLVAPGAQGHPFDGGWPQDSPASARRDFITHEMVQTTATELALDLRADDGDYATVPDEAERYRDGIVTSSDQLLGAAGTNTPFEAAFVETEDGGAVAQVLGAPDLDVAWMAYELEAAPDWEASRQGEAWYRSLQAESDALLEAINAAVVFAAGLLVGVLLGGRMHARSRMGAPTACTACGRPATQETGVSGLALEDAAPPVVLVSVVQA